VSDPEQTFKRLQAMVAERERLAREAQALIDRTRALSEADARLARVLSEVAGLNGVSRRGKKAP
jgi:hypothetical protein